MNTSLFCLQSENLKFFTGNNTRSVTKETGEDTTFKDEK